MSSDPWAAAQTQHATGPADQGQGGQQASSLAPPVQAGPSRLFSQGSSAPSLFNKTHYLGTERTGIITKAPYDQQQQDFNEKRPKYWSLSKVGGKAFTTDAVDAPTGQANRPAMATHVEMQTEYRLDANECAAVGRDPAGIATDDGKRVYVVANQFEYKAFRAAMEAAVKAGVPITKDEDLVGLRLTVRRARQQPNPGGNPSWDPDISLSRP